MKNLTTPGAATRNSFINTFAFGNKSEAILNLADQAHFTHRFDGVTSDEFIYQHLACVRQSQARIARISQAMLCIA